MIRLLPFLIVTACYPGVPPTGTKLNEVGKIGDARMLAFQDKIYITGAAMPVTKVFDPATGALTDEPQLPSAPLFTTADAILAIQQTTFTRYQPGTGGQASGPLDCAPTVVVADWGFCIVPTGEVVRVDPVTFKVTTIDALPTATKIAGRGQKTVYVLPSNESNGGTLRSFPAASTDISGGLTTVLDTLPDHAQLLAAFDDTVIFDSGGDLIAIDTTTKTPTKLQTQLFVSSVFARNGADLLVSGVGALYAVQLLSIDPTSGAAKSHATAHRASGAAVVGDTLYFLAPTEPAWDDSDLPNRTIAIYKTPL